jgi:muramidase (phage lysozyme)
MGAMTSFGKAVFLFSALGLAACSASADDAAPDDGVAWGDGEGAEAVESPVRDANGNEVVTASVSTFLKTSTQDSSSLADANKCGITASTKITLTDLSTTGRHVRGRLVSAPAACAGKANFAAGRYVYVFRDHFRDWSSGTTPVNPSTLPSCDPKRAVGAVNRFQKALHDAIAFAEGTRGRGQDGYNVIFSYQYFTNCDRHPDRVICSGICSSAAGRYQYLTTTWNGLRLPSFNPENQERGAEVLIRRRGVNMPTTRALSSTEFSNAMNALSWEWASLPPGRYGQPVKTLSQMRTNYCSNVGGC